MGWNETHLLNANDATVYDRFGSSVDFNNGQALVGAQFGNSHVESSGAAYIIPLYSSNASPAPSFTPNYNFLEVTFSDTSTDPDGTIVSWAWDFGDGATSTEQNPVHTYANSGEYIVTLTVTDDAGFTDIIAQTVNPFDPIPPVAGFTLAINDLEVTFTDLSTDADGELVNWSWELGDGTTATDQNPVHTYANSGTFIATLTVTDNHGLTDTITKASFEVGGVSVSTDRDALPTEYALHQNYPNP